MDYKIVDKNIIIGTMDAKNKYFLHFLCVGITNQFTYVIDTPRVLIFDEQNLLKKIYKKLQKIGIDIWFCNNIIFFDKMVHFCEFDLGIFVSQKLDYITISFVGGCGNKISQTKFSIIEKEIKKINFFSKKGTKNAKKLEKINKIKIKYKKMNECTNMQTKLQREKFLNFNNNFLDLY